MGEKLIEILVLVILIIFFGGIFWNIFFKNPRTLNSRQLEKIGICEPKSVKRLSVYPFFIWLEKFFITTKTLWFDEEFIYIFDNENLIARYKFNDVTELKKTYSKINTIAIWKISFDKSVQNETCDVYKFAPYKTLMNPNFSEFLRILKDKNQKFNDGI